MIAIAVQHWRVDHLAHVRCVERGTAVCAGSRVSDTITSGEFGAVSTSIPTHLLLQRLSVEADAELTVYVLYDQVNGATAREVRQVACDVRQIQVHFTTLEGSLNPKHSYREASVSPAPQRARETRTIVTP